MVIPNDGVEIITDPVFISVLLEKAKNSHALLSLSLKNTKQDFMSVILSVNEKSISIDQLKPDTGQQIIKLTNELTAEAKMQGSIIRFNSNIKNPNKKSSEYQIDIPKRIEYIQRRSNYRVPVRISLNVQINIKIQNKFIPLGRITDISGGGFRAIIDDRAANLLNNYTSPYNCQISLPNNQNIECRVDICHADRNKHSEKLYIGAKFSKMEPKVKDKILQIVRQLEREAIRRNPI